MHRTDSVPTSRWTRDVAPNDPDPDRTTQSPNEVPFYYAWERVLFVLATATWLTIETATNVGVTVATACASVILLMLADSCMRQEKVISKWKRTLFSVALATAYAAYTSFVTMAFLVAFPTNPNGLNASARGTNFWHPVPGNASYPA